ncbi:MAG TPA: glucokinase [Gammaproteobacteria bacterium]
MIILAGDIGGTKTLMQIASLTANSHDVICEESYVSDRHKEFSDVVSLFLGKYSARAQRINAACFGVAGPIKAEANSQNVQVTNLPWRLDTAQLADLTHIPCIYLINDFQAVGYGIDTLGPADLVTLQAGQSRMNAPRIVLGAGTGLGVAQLIWQHDHYSVLATEGGHIDFAPVSAEQSGLLDFLSRRFNHVSYERLLSGPGLVNIYEYLCSTGIAVENKVLRQVMAQSDAAAAITEFACKKKDALANQALDLFVSIYGAMAGNLALINLAFGGVYVAGGIAPRIIERLRTGDFIRAFNHKGRMSPLLHDMPVHVVMNPKVGLQGATRAAYYFVSAANIQV